MYQSVNQVCVPAHAAEKTMRLMGLNMVTADVVHVPAASGAHDTQQPVGAEVQRSEYSNRTAAHAYHDMAAAQVHVGHKRPQADADQYHATVPTSEPPRLAADSTCPDSVGPIGVMHRSGIQHLPALSSGRASTGHPVDSGHRAEGIPDSSMPHSTPNTNWATFMGHGAPLARPDPALGSNVTGDATTTQHPLVGQSAINELLAQNGITNDTLFDDIEFGNASAAASAPLEPAALTDAGSGPMLGAAAAMTGDVSVIEAQHMTAGGPEV